MALTSITALPDGGGALSINNLAALNAEIAQINTNQALTVTLTGTEVLTNKTLTSPTVTGLMQDVGNALTAVGTNRATALVLTKSINNITSAAAGTGVQLPAATIGATVVIFNAGASLIQVYGAGSDTIDGVSAATGVALTNAKRSLYICVAAATWISAQLGVVSA